MIFNRLNSLDKVLKLGNLSGLYSLCSLRNTRYTLNLILIYCIDVLPLKSKLNADLRNGWCFFPQILIKENIFLWTAFHLPLSYLHKYPNKCHINRWFLQLTRSTDLANFFVVFVFFFFGRICLTSFYVGTNYILCTRNHLFNMV